MCVSLTAQFPTNYCSRGGENCHNVDTTAFCVTKIHRSIVVDELDTKSRDQKIGISYIYFDYKDYEQQTALKTLASLVKQLLLRVEDIIPNIYALYKTLRARGKKPDLPDLLQALYIASTAFTTTFLVLDALDQCEKGQRRHLLDAIRQLPLHAFRIFATSRPHLQDIDRSFPMAPKIDIIADPGDIETFLTRRVEEKIPQYHNLRSKIVEKLSKSAQRV